MSQDLATACVFLAGKVEETSNKLDDTIKVSLQIQHKNALRKNPREPSPNLDLASAEFKARKDKIVMCEHHLLSALTFKLTVDHPYKYLLLHVKNLRLDARSTKELAQVAWNFINDRYLLGYGKHLL